MDNIRNLCRSKWISALNSLALSKSVGSYLSVLGCYKRRLCKLHNKKLFSCIFGVWILQLDIPWSFGFLVRVRLRDTLVFLITFMISFNINYLLNTMSGNPFGLNCVHNSDNSTFENFLYGWHGGIASWYSIYDDSILYECQFVSWLLHFGSSFWLRTWEGNWGYLNSLDPFTHVGDLEYQIPDFGLSPALANADTGEWASRWKTPLSVSPSPLPNLSFK